MQNIRCAHCGLLNFASAGECKRCHSPLVEEAAAGESFGGGTRCGFCGLETEAAYCPRCKARVTQPAATFDARGSSSPGGGRAGGRALRWLVVLAVLAGAGFAAYSYRQHIWYGHGAEYALAIGEAEQFNEPLTVKAKKRIRLGQGTGGAVFKGPDRANAVFVLKERGLVEFGKVKTEERVVGTYTMPPPPTFSDSGGPAPESVEVKQQLNTTTAALTPSGEQVAGDWKDADDGAWLVPIGSREVYRVEKVGEVESAAGVETCDVEFSWRWRPNNVGEAFDTDGKFFASQQDEDVRMAIEKFNWGTAKIYRAVAHFERRAGGKWNVVGIEKSDNIDKKTELSAF
jgi:hypothetical protein